MELQSPGIEGIGFGGEEAEVHEDSTGEREKTHSVVGINKIYSFIKGPLLLPKMFVQKNLPGTFNWKSYKECSDSVLS